MDTDRPGLVLPSPETISPATVPALLVQVAAWQSAVAARMLTTPAAPPVPEPSPTEPPPDQLLDAAAAAALLHRSVSWLRKHGRDLLGFYQAGGPGHAVAWRRRDLEAWVRTQTRS